MRDVSGTLLSFSGRVRSRGEVIPPAIIRLINSCLRSLIPVVRSQIGSARLPEASAFGGLCVATLGFFPLEMWD